jgi:Radical SAM superfamily
MKVLLVTPPLTQLNTPYPATAYLTGFLQSRGVDVVQADPALMWVLALLSEDGLRRWLPQLESAHPSVQHARKHAEKITAVMPGVVRFLQGRDPSLASRIATRKFLPEGPRFSSLGPTGHEEEYLDWAFGTNGLADRARFFASLFLEDVLDALTHGVDPFFGFSRYGESLAASTPTIDPLLSALEETPVTARVLEEITLSLLKTHSPGVVGMTLPFPGNVLGALRMAQTIKKHMPQVKIVWGGGYVNTELRSLSDPRVFDFVDALTYDDGEAPLLAWLAHQQDDKEPLLRTRVRENGEVVWKTSALPDIAMKDAGTPTYQGLPLDAYLSIIDMLNPMHRLWSETRWNKLTVAHGCYWKKCSFCDLSLDYISRYDPLAASALVTRIEAMIDETGTRGFHFVDEAAPPAGLKALAEALIAKRTEISWWGNIRFEKTFTAGLCKLLADSGCIAVSGGLEVASNRLLALMQKGVTVEQVARVTKGFSDAGIRVHAYLMYGFPSQNVQETVDSLEMVRQLFIAGCLDSAYWHRFSATAHSPVGREPHKYGIDLRPMPDATFARNDLHFTDPTGVDHDALGVGLKKAVYNYMLGMGLEEDVRVWFATEVPKTTVKKRFIADALR